MVIEDWGNRLSNDMRNWLEEVGLSQYGDLLSANGVGMDVVDELGKDDLEALGMPLGDRLRLIKAIRRRLGGAQAPAPMVEISPAPDAPPNDAERRPLTVMFCDLADSTALSTRLDPEDLQDVIRAYQDACAKVVLDYGGFVAKYMGDGILIYFGYPKSLERNAERAVRSALGILEAMIALNGTLGRDKGVGIAVRIGIATGTVMVGELVGEGTAQERTVIGEAPNLAARLQGLAGRNAIVVGDLTRDLAGGAFTYDAFGVHELKGIAAPVRTWVVAGLRDDAAQDARIDENDGAEEAPDLVGRDEEIGLLRRAWAGAKDEGLGQAVALTGAAGIGKSALIDGLKAELRAEGLAQLTMRCSPYHANSALHPVIEHFKRLARWRPEDDAATRLGKLETMLGRYDQPPSEAVPLMASLLSLNVPEGRYPPMSLTPQQQKQLTQDMIIGITMQVAESRPFLQVWEDLHWADPSTLELIGLLLDQAPTASLLMVTTARPEFMPPWPVRSHVTPITLNRLERPHAEALVARIAGDKSLPAEVVGHIVAKTDGVPLYVEELTKTILASDILRDAGDHFELTGPLASLSIPDTLQDSLMARLDRLPQMRELAQLGSVLGREFAYEMISGLSGIADATLREGLGQLVGAELLYQRGRPPRARYIFKHALIQDAAYASLLRRARQQVHQQAAELLVARFPDAVDANPEIVAHHFAEAGLTDLAVEHFQKAGERSLRRSANEEAVAHLGKGLQIIQAASDGVMRDREELSLLTMIAPALVAVRGYAAPQVDPAYRRALDLCRTLGDVKTEYAVLCGQSMFHFLRADLAIARDLAEKGVDLAQTFRRQGGDLAAQRQLGLAVCFLGDFEGALACFDYVSSAYDVGVHGALAFRQSGSDIGVGAIATKGFALVPLGRLDEAVEQCEEALALAERLDHPVSVAYAHWASGFVRRQRREPKAALEHAAAVMAIAEDQGFPQYIAWITGLRGGLHLDRGAFPEAIAELRKGIAANHAIGSKLFTPDNYIDLGDALGRNGEVDEGLAVIAGTIDHIARTGETKSNAEVYRVKGQLLLMRGDASADEAETNFRKAIEIARSQKARLLELRAATSLGRLWRDQGRQDHARTLLQPVYDWFAEGLDTADLKAAEALLDELA